MLRSTRIKQKGRRVLKRVKRGRLKKLLKLAEKNKKLNVDYSK
jgi:hypothetical protein